MPAQAWATGVVWVFTAVGAQAPRFFGTTESMPQDTRTPEYEPLMNDITGSRLPLDMAWQGMSAQVSLVMTRWDEAVAEQLLQVPTSIGLSGQWRLSDIGALVGQEGLSTIQLWLAYSNNAGLAQIPVKPAYANMIPGRHYLQCVMMSPQSDETGTKPRKRHFQFFAWPKLDFTVNPAVARLYNQDMSAVTNVVIT